MGWYSDEQAFAFNWDDGYPDENCLRVNIWTPGLKDGKKRPVMVWLHGGGYSAGSGQELPSYDGTNLAKKGDAVVVTLNHRLNVLGFLDLSAYGDKYAKSGNAGLLDLVAALQWVLCCGDDIIWLVGERADNRFRIDEKTRKVLVVSTIDQ